MELTGHTGEIFSAKFDLTGNLIASGSMDRSISRTLHFCFVPSTFHFLVAWQMD